jgi:hypothetical protein
LGQLRLRSANSRTYYRQVLHGFQDIAERRQAIDQETLEEWLREIGAHWHPSTVLHRARIVDRFLDHLAGQGLITSNPIVVLCSEYSVKQSRPIWQALTSPMPDQALAALRRLKPFGSVLGETMREHSERMQQGISLQDTGRMVPAVRPIPSGPSGACERTGHDDAGALGGSQDNPSSHRRMREAEASSHQGPSASGPERAGEATGPAATEGSGKALSEAAHL